MKGNEGPEGQKLENGAGPGAAKFFIWGTAKADRFWQLVGSYHKAKMKEKKAQKARMKGSEGPKGQNERK